MCNTAANPPIGLLAWCCLLGLLLGASAHASDTRFALPLDWSDDGGRYAVGTRVELPDTGLDRVDELVGTAQGWCIVARLVPDVRECRPWTDGMGLELTLQSGDGTQRTQPHTIRHTRLDDEIRSTLIAKQAPLGVTDAGLRLTASGNASAVTLTVEYGYQSSLRSRLATRAYLSGSAGARPGISEEPGPEGDPVLVSGLRGLVERNAMRYFLALVSALEHTGPEQAVSAWLRAASRFEADLVEQDETAYRSSRPPPVVD